MKECLACGGFFAGDTWKCPRCHVAPPTADEIPSFVPDRVPSEGFQAEFFAELAELEADNFWFRARNRLIVQTLRQYFPRARSFFEIGCGTGFVLAGISAAFPRLHLTGSEFFGAGLQFARQRAPHATLLRMDARVLPFADEFDVIGAFDVLEHIEEDAAVLAQMFKATRPGGGVIVTVPQHPWLWSRADERARHVRRYRAIDLRRRVVAAGYEVLYMTSFVAWLLPLMVMARWMDRWRRAEAKDQLPSGLRLPRWVNRLLEAVLSFEGRTIAAGIRYPWGGSLLMVARKGEGAN